MERIARYAKMTARRGYGGEVADLLLTAADGLRGDPGCELYLVHRQADAPDTIWVTELWRSRADLDAALRGLAGDDDVAAVLGRIESNEMIELDLLGGKGPAAH
ncbi:putative quinol monooxygenase [Murinocardiopsis flavida]|nr:antibiotic biosynthesis monooxygenase family protein [Murinocardiopsis flavida]